MNCATQIVEANYQFILKQARLIKRGDAEASGDLAHDTVEKILKMDKVTINKLKQNPKGFIHTMLSNSNINDKIKDKVRDRFKVQMLYSRKPHEEQETFLPDELSNDPYLLADKIAKIKELTQIERMWLSVFITYPDTSIAAKKLNIHWHTVKKYKKRIFDKLK